MISRRNIRVKVMQCLYTQDSIQPDLKPGEAVSLLKKQIAQSRQLFVYLVHFITDVALYVEKDAAKRASKHLPTASDLNINTKIAGNEVLWKIMENPGFRAAVTELKPDSITDNNLLKKTYESLVNSPLYKEYIEDNTRSRKGEQEILEYIFTDLMLPNEDFISHIEELFINWDDDADMMHNLVPAFIQKPGSYDFGEMISKEKWDFAQSLLETTIDKKDICMDLLKPKLKNWDAERIAALDLIIIRLGICEFLFFETIPVKVTINEYIDLAKEYSTPQSGQFINGILDNINKELTAQGRIIKKNFKNSTL